MNSGNNHFLYAICGILGVSALMFTTEKLLKAGIVIVIGFAIFLVNYLVLRNPKSRSQSGLDLKNIGGAEYKASAKEKNNPEEGAKEADSVPNISSDNAQSGEADRK